MTQAIVVRNPTDSVYCDAMALRLLFKWTESSFLRLKPRTL